MVAAGVPDDLVTFQGRAGCAAFTLRDIETGAVLILGRIADPSGS